MIRFAELATLDSLLQRHRKTCPDVTTLTVTINGMSGTGKTSLALHWAQQIKNRFPDGHLYVNLCGYSSRPPLSPLEALGGFLQALGIRDNHLPASLGDRAALYRNVVAGRRMLIVLDAAAASDQVRQLLPHSPESVVLITSRDRLSALDNAHCVDLDVLGIDEAMALLRDIAGADRVDAEPRVARDLVRLCGYLPLAIHLAAGHLSRHPDSTTTSLVSTLQAEQPRPDNHAPGLLSSVRTAIDISYQSLPSDAQRLFRCLGTLQSPHFDELQAADLAEATAEETNQLVNILVSAHMISRRQEDNYYRIHDLLLAYARELLNNNEISVVGPVVTDRAGRVCPRTGSPLSQ